MATLKQLIELDITAQPLAITYPTLEVPLKHNFGFLNLLPKFLGQSGEDLHCHVNESIITCSTIHQDGMTEDKVMLMAFPFTLQDTSNDWLYYVMPGSITSWQQLHKTEETLYEYWECFNTCTHVTKRSLEWMPTQDARHKETSCIGEFLKWFNWVAPFLFRC